MLDTEGKLISIPADAIDDARRAISRLMPHGLKDGMILEDLADIVAYLEKLKQAAK